MKTIKYLLLFAIGMTISVSSCKKDSAAKSKKDILTSHQWRISYYKLNGQIEPMADCDKDDFVVFSANGTYIWNPTTVKCNSNETTEVGVWSLSADETVFSIDYSVATLNELTNSKLVITSKDGTDTMEQGFTAF